MVPKERTTLVTYGRAQSESGQGKKGSCGRRSVSNGNAP